MLRDLPPFAGDEGHYVFMNGVPGNEEESQPYVDPFDDVFGSAPASPSGGGDDDDLGGVREPGLASTRDHSDISRLRSTHVTNGYREGIAASKELHMQDGFDEGYNLGAELGLKAGWTLGALEGIWRAVPAERTEPSSTGAGDGNGLGTGELGKLLDAAKTELDISQLCGKDYFGEDGLWLYEVPGQHEVEHEVTFEAIAAAHPLLQKWTTNVLQLAAQVGLRLGTKETSKTGG